MPEEIKLLVVDDDQGTGETLKEILEAKGYPTKVAQTGQEALEMAQTEPFNVALIDIKLPDVDGIRLLGKLREAHPEIAAVMVTGYASLQNAVAALNQGAEAYVMKPLDMDELLAVVRKAAEKQQLIRQNQRLLAALALQIERLKQKGQELEEAYLELGKTLALSVEARDHYTRGHSERVTQLAQGIAAQLSCSEEDIRHLQVAGRLHDIGKIAIPDSILLKPGPLTPAEWAVIQQHPTQAVEMLRFLDSLKPVFPLIEGHHERYDGGGYPNRLKGQEIPCGARILAVADAYDAMTSDRPYRPALAHEAAIRTLTQGAGSQWDPEVVDAFARTIEQTDLVRPGLPPRGQLPPPH